MIYQRFPSFDEVQAGVRHILQFDDYSINVVNSEVPGQVETMLNDKGQLELTQTVNFFIGGIVQDILFVFGIAFMFSPLLRMRKMNGGDACEYE